MPKAKWTPFVGPDWIWERQVRTGDIVRPWISAGPIFKDVSAEVPGNFAVRTLGGR